MDSQNWFFIIFRCINSPPSILCFLFFSQQYFLWYESVLDYSKTRATLLCVAKYSIEEAKGSEINNTNTWKGKEMHARNHTQEERIKIIITFPLSSNRVRKQHRQLNSVVMILDAQYNKLKELQSSSFYTKQIR